MSAAENIRHNPGAFGQALVRGLPRVDVAAKAVEEQGLIALFLHKAIHFACKVGGYGGIAAAENAVAGRADSCDGSGVRAADGKAAHSAVHRAVGISAVVDVITRQCFAHMRKVFHLGKVGKGSIHRLIDAPGHGRLIGVIHIAAALVVLTDGPVWVWTLTMIS